MPTERPVDLVDPVLATPDTPIDAQLVDHRAQQLLGQAAYAAILTGQPENARCHLVDLPDDALDEIANAAIDLAGTAAALRRATPDGITAQEHHDRRGRIYHVGDETIEAGYDDLGWAGIDLVNRLVTAIARQFGIPLVDEDGQ